MPATIPQSKYINIKSGIAGSGVVSQRELIGRIFSTNPLIPTGKVLEFDGGAMGALPTIADYFGIQSAEYKIAQQYFNFKSNAGQQAKKISFARFSPDETSSTLYGTKKPALADLQSETAGTLTITVNKTPTTAESINLSAKSTLQEIAEALTAEVTAAGASVEYDAVNERFVLKTTAVGADEVLGYATGTIAEKIGWTQTSGILSAGADVETPLSAVTKSVDESNNFFSFCFLEKLSKEEHTALGAWGNSQNYRYMYSITTTKADNDALQEAMKDYTGTAITIDETASNGGILPMAGVASVDFTRPNAAIDMMYQKLPGMVESVGRDEYKKYDDMNVNYFGATSQAGQKIVFYQNGVLQGETRSIGVYANEAWLKDAMFTVLLNLRTALDSLPANDTGKALIMTAMSEVIDLALVNGVIIPGKALDSTQKSAITQITGNEKAWQNVLVNGYWFDVAIEKVGEQYQANYILVYSKGDSVNYITGSDILI